jgi:hypothetical protein
MTVRHEKKTVVPNATEVRPGVFVSNSSSSVFIRSAPPSPKKK